LLNGIANSSITIREYVNNLETGTTHALTGAVLATTSLPTVIDYSYSDPLYPYYPTIEFKFDNTIYLNPNAQYVIEFIPGNGVTVYCRTQDMYNGGQAYDINGINLSFARDFPFELYVVNQPITPLTSGTVTYPSTHGTAGQVLTTNGSGTAIWSTPATVDTSNFVNLTTNQTVAGAKTFNSNISVNGVTIGIAPGNNTTNTVLGGAALGNNTTGTYNTAIGGSTLFKNTTGSQNIAGGQGALENSLNGNNNAAIGSNALFSNTSGSGNTAFGVSSLYSNTTGQNNTAIGFGADVSSLGLSNASAIGYGAVVTANNKIQLGNTSVTNVNTSGSITANAEISSEITANLTINNANAEQYKAKVLICNPSSPITITFGNDLPVGFNCMVLQKSADANKINLAGGAGVTIKNRSNYTATAGNYAIATIVNIGGGIIVTAGDMQ